MRTNYHSFLTHLPLICFSYAWMRTLLLSAFCDAVIHVLGSFSSSLLLQNLLMAFIVLIAAVAYLDSLYQTCQQLLSSPSQFQVFIISRGLLLLFLVFFATISNAFASALLFFFIYVFSRLSSLTH